MSLADFQAAVEKALPPSVYARPHGATVVHQHDDGTVDLVVDGFDLAAQLGVPLRIGIPGARVIVPASTRLRLAFENHDPSLPYATAMDADPAASRGVARVGDTVDCGTLTVTGGSGSPVLFVYTPPGAPPTDPLPIVSLRGVIDSGSGIVRLGDG